MASQDNQHEISGKTWHWQEPIIIWDPGNHLHWRAFQQKIRGFLVTNLSLSFSESSCTWCFYHFKTGYQPKKMDLENNDFFKGTFPTSPLMLASLAICIIGE